MRMKVAAYQAPLAPGPINPTLALIRKQIDRCEALGVEFLCCPEAVLGGLADYVERLASHGSSSIVDGSGQVLAAAPPWTAELVMSNIAHR